MLIIITSISIDNTRLPSSTPPSSLVSIFIAIIVFASIINSILGISIITITTIITIIIIVTVTIIIRAKPASGQVDSVIHGWADGKADV